MRRITIILASIIALISCSKSELKDPQERDKKRLEDMLRDIHDIVDSVDCEDSADWEFTAIGSKACGGPQSYIAVPLAIDTAEFMDQVRRYTKAEQDYNVTYKIISTCDVVAPPTDVVCEDGQPKLIYSKVSAPARPE